MPEPLPIRSLNHFTHRTRNLETTIAFYRDVLGFRRIWRPPFDFPGAWMFNCGVQLHLIDKRTDAGSDGEIQTRADHMSFHVDDIEQAKALLEEHGIPYKSNVVPVAEVLQLFFTDPDGYHIEVGSYPSAPRELDGA